MNAQRIGNAAARAAASLLALLWFACVPAFADYNLGGVFGDLWWNPNESGWGVTVDHQDQVMFLTFYVYRADNSPYWVTAILYHVPGTGYTFTGDLSENRGPWFGGSFNPALVTVRTAGTATFRSTDIIHATLTYIVDGVTVTKPIERITLQNLNFSGTFVGAIGYFTSGCVVPGDNGQAFGDIGQMTITHVGTNLRIVFSGLDTTCTLNGTYAQTGNLGSAQGTLSCTDGTTGSFNLMGMEWTIAGMTALLGGHNQQCGFTGAVTGMMPH